MIGASNISEMFRQYGMRFMSTVKQPVSHTKMEGAPAASPAMKAEVASKPVLTESGIDRLVQSEMLIIYD